jgi:hypothetical protein
MVLLGREVPSCSASVSSTPRAQLDKFRDKGDTFETRPCSGSLIGFLVDLTTSRGGQICNPELRAHGRNAPLFHFKNSSPEQPHGVTGRRSDTILWRIKLALSWATLVATAYSGLALRHAIRAHCRVPKRPQDVAPRRRDEEGWTQRSSVRLKSLRQSHRSCAANTLLPLRRTNPSSRSWCQIQYIT